MIWDVLDYDVYEIWNWIEYYQDGTRTKLWMLWKYKRLSIEKQSDETVKFVFDLLPKN
jgi:hypothetical protein